MRTSVVGQLAAEGSLSVHESAGLAQVTGDAPAAVLLVDLPTRSVVYANPIAQHLAPGVALPAGVDEWSDAAALRDLDGAELSETNHPLSLVARSTPVVGQAVSAARATQMGRQREPLWVVALPMGDAPRLEGHALVVLLPLSGREAAEAAVSAAAAQADLRDRAVLATGMAFTVADARADDLPLIWVNPAFTAATGYSLDDAVGRNCRFLQGPATDPTVVAGIREALAAGRDVTATLLNYRKDGTAFWNQVSMSPIHDAGGVLTHFVGIQTDVTVRVAADVARDRALGAERVAREDAESARAAAEQAQAEAEAARAEAERAHERLGLLAEATGQLAVTLDVDACRQRLADLTVPALADWVLVATADAQGRIEQVTARHVDPDGQAGLERYVEQLHASRGRAAIAAPLLPGGRARLIADYASPSWRAERQRWVREGAAVDLGDDLAAASVLVVPLPGRQVQRDVMVLVRGPGRAAHTEDDVAVATDLGRRAGLILDNARLYQGEHRIAEALQRSLLPELPPIPGIAAAARYRPGTAGAEVGGDFYELIELPGGAVGLAIGDVMGHDVMAAAAMGHLRGLLRACAFDTDPPRIPGDRRRRRVQDPGDVLDRVDQLVQGLGIATLATIAYARFEPVPTDGPGRTWLARYASAGHPPLLVRHPDGGVEVLDDAEGLLIGVQASPRATVTRSLAVGATVLAYTDGLIERRGESPDVGVARLAAALATGPADVEAVVDHVLDQCGDVDDDVAVIALRL